MRRALFAWTLTLAFLSASTASAQNADTMADARFHEGMAFTKAGDFESARLAFSQALSIRRNADTLWNLAIIEKQLHREVEASRHIREYLRSPKHHAADEGPAKRLLDEMSPRIAHLRIDAPAGATVLVDGEALRDPAPVPDVYDVAVGEHVVRASSDNAAGETKTSASPGVETAVTVTFAAPQSAGHVIEPPKTEERAKVFPPPTGAIVLGGLGVVGLGLGVGFSLDSQSKHDEFSREAASSPCSNPSSAACAQANDASSSADRSKAIAIVSYAAGGALVAGGVVWWFLAPRKETVVMGFRPWISPRSAGVGFAKDF